MAGGHFGLGVELSHVAPAPNTRVMGRKRAELDLDRLVRERDDELGPMRGVLVPREGGTGGHHRQLRVHEHVVLGHPRVVGFEVRFQPIHRLVLTELGARLDRFG